MGLPFFSHRALRREQVVSVDLGGRTTKAVYLRRHGERYSLVNYVILDAPVSDKALTEEQMTAHLREVSQALGSEKAKWLTIALGVNEIIFRQIDLPLMPVSDLRQMLKLNSKNYLQQELTDYVFDCCFVTGKPAKSTDAAKSGAGGSKQKALIGGAKRQVLDQLQSSIRNAGYVPDQIVPALIGPANAFELAQPELFAKEGVALVDLGFKSSSITILECGEIKLHRVVNIGGDRLTAGLAEAMGITYKEAEGIKVGMPSEVQVNLEPLIVPLGRELRASIDFFENQNDRTVSNVFLSGGSARSEFIVQTLQTELTVPCKAWSPTRFLDSALSPEKAKDLDSISAQLTVAIGAAATAISA